MPPDRTVIECSEQPDCVRRFAVLETKMTTVERQGNKILEKIEGICPLVKENSWWIEKIKWGFVFVSVAGVVMGVVSWIKYR